MIWKHPLAIRHRLALLYTAALGWGWPSLSRAEENAGRVLPPSLDDTPLAMILTLLALAMIATALIALLNKRHWH